LAEQVRELASLARELRLRAGAANFDRGSNSGLSSRKSSNNSNNGDKASE
jgi:hypothetical protein